MDKKPFVVWFTGLSGAGKTTLAYNLRDVLFDLQYQAYVLDGDILRTGLCSDLGFSQKDRSENIRRVAQVAKLFLDVNVCSIVSFISPYKEDRRLARDIIGDERFLEVYCQCPLEVCEERDVKGLYKKARKGEIKKFTGIDDPYEEPEGAELILDTAENTVQNCTLMLVEKIRKI